MNFFNYEAISPRITAESAANFVFVQQAKLLNSEIVRLKLQILRLLTFASVYPTKTLADSAISIVRIAKVVFFQKLYSSKVPLKFHFG